jgi:hypothetical protein
MRRFDRFALTLFLLCEILGLLTVAPSGLLAAQNSGAAVQWQSPARLRGLLGGKHGVLIIGDRGVEFRPRKAVPLRWSYEDIQSFHLTARRLDLESYQNRSWHFPGDRIFHLGLQDTVPPEVAAELARRVQKPVKNALPDPHASAFSTLSARHRTFGGGTNGVLRFRQGGIDYVTTSARGSRSWRWSDIQTIANPDPYHFRLQGYRETFEFELKQPMSRELFDRLWDAVYARDLKGLAYSEGRRQ